MLIKTLYSVAIKLVSCLLKLNFIGKKWKQFLQQQKLFYIAILNYKPKENSFWFIVSSAGEMEQAFPIINKIKQSYTDAIIVVSFFSSSGFEMYENHSVIDFCFYFPLDTKKNARLMVETINAKAVFFIRYEIWLNTLIELKKINTPTFLINNESKKRFFIYQCYLNYSYTFFTRIFDSTTFGDTKIEQALLHKKDTFEHYNLKQFCKDYFVLLLGSCYLEEISIAHAWYKKLTDKTKVRIIVCPHQPNDDLLQTVQLMFDEQVNIYTNAFNFKNNILYINKKGILKYLYQFADISFIGGGFKNALHNIYEALVYNTIVCCGDELDVFPTEKKLVENKIIFNIHETADFEKLYSDFIANRINIDEIQQQKMDFLRKHKNASEKIWQQIKLDL